VLAAQPCVICVHGIPSAGVLKSQRLARQSLGKAVVGSGPRFVEVVHGGIVTSTVPAVIVVILSLWSLEKECKSGCC
jgi:hypothetical protein